jgi:hypothetical protein
MSLLGWTIPFIVTLVWLGMQWPGYSASPPAKGASAGTPTLTLSTSSDILSRKRDIRVQAMIWSPQPLTVCLEEPIESLFSVELSRGGTGRLTGQPQVMQLDKKPLPPKKVQLKAGQSQKLSFSLKKWMNQPPDFWQAGEYTARVKFYLCQDKGQAEQVISARLPLRFLLVE